LRFLDLLMGTIRADLNASAELYSAFAAVGQKGCGKVLNDQVRIRVRIQVPDFRKRAQM
jgi:hypothetical protein